MIETILSIILFISLFVSIYFTVRKRKKLGIAGFKTSLTSICFFLIAAVNLFGYWFNLLGIGSWLVTMILILVGAYFTKYMPRGNYSPKRR
ncbi:hypothetical protein FS935_20105 [Metabacillus litoralis]|uniref:Uncharacterized protein n=1 Tax=Metabacillus litoralis TaxID=152268 RepID=A0A5C6VKU5_9BACI|nr:hypothetical protein [Metabacillus litoralis]TXC85670.1 hypothetical protein FS935_20105 [Metabacillus litoralis]